MRVCACCRLCGIRAYMHGKRFAFTCCTKHPEHETLKWSGGAFARIMVILCLVLFARTPKRVAEAEARTLTWRWRVVFSEHICIYIHIHTSKTRTHSCTHAATRVCTSFLSSSNPLDFSVWARRTLNSGDFLTRVEVLFCGRVSRHRGHPRNTHKLKTHAPVHCVAVFDEKKSEQSVYV